MALGRIALSHITTIYQLRLGLAWAWLCCWLLSKESVPFCLSKLCFAHLAILLLQRLDWLESASLRLSGHHVIKKALYIQYVTAYLLLLLHYPTIPILSLLLAQFDLDIVWLNVPLLWYCRLNDSTSYTFWDMAVKKNIKVIIQACLHWCLQNQIISPIRYGEKRS